MDTAFLLTLLLPVAVVSHTLELPRSVQFKVGDRNELRCRMLSCPEKVKFVWTALGDKPIFATPKTGDKETVLIFDNVTKNHANAIVCRAACGKEMKELTTQVNVYSFPRNPVISGYDHLIMGKENVLSCEVSSVYPSEYFDVEWLYENRVVHRESGDFDKDAVSIPYTFTPSSEDDGKAITCRASLNIEGVPPEEKTKETSRHIKVLSAPHNVEVSGETAVSLGSSLTLTCEAEGNPKPAFTWTALKPDGHSVELGKQRDLFMHNVSLSDAGTYQCNVSNDLGNQMVNVSVVVQAPPVDTRIVASPQSSLKEGDSVTIFCKSSGVPVIRVVLSNVAKTILKTKEGAETSVTIDSVKLSDTGMFVCEAFNEYGSQRTTLNLNVEAHLLDVELQPNGTVVSDRGSSLVLSCQASGCPHPEFSWKNLSNMSVHRQPKTEGSLSQLLFDPVEVEDEGTYVCEVTCGSIKKSKQTEVKVFSFATCPIVKSSGPSLAGERMKLTCTVQDVFPVNLFQILWLDGEREIWREESQSFSSGSTDLTSVYSLQVDAEDQDRHITCKVLLDMHGVPPSQVVKTASTTLSIHYPPRATRIIASPLTKLKEGEPVSFSCLSDSFPAGRMVLSRVVDGIRTELKTIDGVETSFTLPSVTLDDAGIYVCEASNIYGNHSDSLEITVKAPPRNTTVEIFPSTNVQEGQNITICCRSVSFPPPAVVLSKLDSETNIYSLDGVFILMNLTPNDTGLYQVNVTNDLGYETEVFNINVIEKRLDSPLGWTDFLTLAIFLGGSAALLGLVLYVWRERKKGFYDLTKGII